MAPVAVPTDFRMTEAEYNATHVTQGMADRPHDEILSPNTILLAERYERAKQMQDPVGTKRYGQMHQDAVRADVYHAVLALRGATANWVRHPVVRLNHVGSNGLTLRALDTQLRAHHFAAGQSFHGAHPFVGFVPGPTGVEVGGRFFPSRNAILVYACGDAGVERATVEHELAHWECYQARCAGTAPSHRNKCEYGGQHDAQFYAVLEKRHRAAGVRPADARLVEGSYDRPRGGWWAS